MKKCNRNKLFLNYPKCKCITFSRNVNLLNFNYSLSGKVIETKDLGLLFDTELNFNKHIDNTVTPWAEFWKGLRGPGSPQ